MSESGEAIYGVEVINHVPYLCQHDYGHVPYNRAGRTVDTSGCGITCFSMVASWCSGRLITPEETAPWAMENEANTVLSWESFGKLADHYGCRLLGQYDGPLFGGSMNRIVKALQAGNVIIASHTGGYFNPGSFGHYVVYTGITADGCVLVNDPNSREKSGVPVPLAETASHCKQIWIFAK